VPLERVGKEGEGGDRARAPASAWLAQVPASAAGATLDVVLEEGGDLLLLVWADHPDLGPGVAPRAGAPRRLATCAAPSGAFGGLIPHGARVLAAIVPSADMRSASANVCELKPHRLAVGGGAHGGACRLALTPAPSPANGGPDVSLFLMLRAPRAARNLAEAAAAALPRFTDPDRPPTLHWRFHFDADDGSSRHYVSQTSAGWACALCGVDAATRAGLAAHLAAAHDHLAADVESSRVNLAIAPGAYERGGGGQLRPAPPRRGGAGHGPKFQFAARGPALAARAAAAGVSLDVLHAARKRKRAPSEDAGSSAAPGPKGKAPRRAVAAPPLPLPRALAPPACFHARTALPMPRDRVVAIMADPTAHPDSDDDGDEAGWHERAARVLARRPGLGDKDRAFALAWTSHVRAHPILCDASVPAAAAAFARAHAAPLTADPGLRAAFGEHLLTLHDFHLLTPDQVRVCLMEDGGVCESGGEPGGSKPAAAAAAAGAASPAVAATKEPFSDADDAVHDPGGDVVVVSDGSSRPSPAAPPRSALAPLPRSRLGGSDSPKLIEGDDTDLSDSGEDA
jgi:hypothetical protein